jgi:hypothetical protein
MKFARRNWKLSGLALLLVALVAIFASSVASGGSKSNRISFDMVRSTASENAGCLKQASGHVTIKSVGPVEIMTVRVEGLPANTEFDFFVIQVPNTPFGLSWYQGDIETNHRGRGFGNPQTAPVHTFHLGLWFNDPADSVKAGCANAVTPFNGDHNAGPQALSTKNFANDQGPLRMLTP